MGREVEEGNAGHVPGRGRAHAKVRDERTHGVSKEQHEARCGCSTEDKSTVSSPSASDKKTSETLAHLQRPHPPRP